MADLTDYQWLVSEEGEKWLVETARSTEPPHRLQTRLRKTLACERARLVSEQTELRRRAVEKFGEHAERMFFTNVALQQATDRWIAAYKASRFDVATPIIDYCCGIGGDLVALARRGPTVGWDRSPEAVIFARANLCVSPCEGEVRLGDVEQHPPHVGHQWHLDPDRREGGRRSTHLQHHSPNGQTIENWLDGAPDAAVKLAPATDLSANWQHRAELEWISWHRQCRQLVAWFGSLAQTPGQRRATVVAGEAVHYFVGDAEVLPEVSGSVGEFIYDTDPAIRAARLTAALAESVGCQVLAEGESYLTADHWIAHPLVTGFRVLDTGPLRIKDLEKRFSTAEIGQLEIKTRGVDTKPEQVRKKLRLKGDKSLTLFLTRQEKQEIAILAERIHGVTDGVTSR